jgi:hypothetical protein
MAPEKTTVIQNCVFPFGSIALDLSQMSTIDPSKATSAVRSRALSKWALRPRLTTSGSSSGACFISVADCGLRNCANVALEDDFLHLVT